MQTYSIKVAIRGISPMIWRRFQLSDNTSLADLHQIIQISMGWDDEHLHQFKIHAKRYGIHYEGGAGFMDSAHHALIKQFEFDIGDKFTYEYNFYESRLCDIRIEKIEDCEAELSCPICIGGSRIYHEYPVRSLFDILEDMVPLIKILMTKITKPRLRKAQELSEEYQSVMYSRKRINQQLLAFSSDPSYR